MKYLEGKKILIAPSTFCAYDRGPLDVLKNTGCQIIDNPFKRKLTKEEVINLLFDDVAGIIAGLESLDRQVLETSKLKVISRCGSGLSNVDLEAARELGIKVYSTPYGPVSAVAELTLGAMLNLLREISLMNAQMHEGKWTKKTGFQLEGKTVVIIGFGRIGRRVKELLEPFKVKIIAVDPNLNPQKEIIEGLSLPDALKKADIISIHANGEEELIGEKEFGFIKQGSFLLNASRGEVVNEKFLIEALQNGKIAGAWFDTFAEEPYKGPLTAYPQVLLTPHIGSYTYECRKAMEMESVNNLIEAFMTKASKG